MSRLHWPNWSQTNAFILSTVLLHWRCVFAVELGEAALAGDASWLQPPGLSSDSSSRADVNVRSSVIHSSSPLLRREAGDGAREGAAPDIRRTHVKSPAWGTHVHEHASPWSAESLAAATERLAADTSGRRRREVPVSDKSTAVTKRRELLRSDVMSKEIRVSCGGHAATECAACTTESKMSHLCGGDCVWKSTGCFLRDDLVWCGSHSATSCRSCVDGAEQLDDVSKSKWCKGECGMYRGNCSGAEEVKRQETKIVRMAFEINFSSVAIQEKDLPESDAVFFGVDGMRMAFHAFGKCTFDGATEVDMGPHAIGDCMQLCLSTDECIAATVGGKAGGSLFSGAAEVDAFACVFYSGSGHNFTTGAQDSVRCYRKLLPSPAPETPSTTPFVGILPWHESNASAWWWHPEHPHRRATDNDAENLLRPASLLEGGSDQTESREEFMSATNAGKPLLQGLLRTTPPPFPITTLMGNATLSQLVDGIKRAQEATMMKELASGAKGSKASSSNWKVFADDSPEVPVRLIWFVLPCFVVVGGMILVITFLCQVPVKPRPPSLLPPPIVEPPPPPPPPPPTAEELAAAAVLAAAENAPEVITISGSVDSDSSYLLVQGQFPGGHPLWKRQSGEPRWIFASPSGQWFVGDADEAELQFQTDTGRIASVWEHEGTFPHEMSEWMQYEGGEWKANANIRFNDG
eukprot:TRINITY_DN60842_c0_g1_i1.p1 TRINITY_DN60842_c0_g1~~TRINITY_DN60842_c0_g1_i1.p1  ORF type:complete len:692 (+),score=126.98 TRINITY_DN60842_c0_g1_i1:111-2186(+)